MYSLCELISMLLRSRAVHAACGDDLPHPSQATCRSTKTSARVKINALRDRSYSRYEPSLQYDSHAGTHVVHHFLGDHVAFANWSMASLAGCACTNVYTVAEVNEGRDPVDPDPRYWLLLFREGRDLLNVGTVGFYCPDDNSCRNSLPETPSVRPDRAFLWHELHLQCQSQVCLMTIGNWLLLAV